MRILWCEQRHSNTKSPDHLRYKMMNKLGDDITFLWNDRTVDIPKEYPKENYDAVLLYFSLADFNNKWQTLADYPVPKLMIISDPEREILQHVEFVKKFKIDMLLFLYPSWIPEYQKHLNCKMISFPWWIDDGKTNVEKNIDLSYAAEYTEYHPIRMRMTYDERIRKLNIVKQPLSLQSNVSAENYVDILNRTKLFVFDGSRDRYANLKYIEGGMAECCILATVPLGEEFVHLKQYENYVPITIDNYYDKILEYLDDYDAAKRIASNGRMTYLKYHTTEIRMNELLRNLETLINGR